MFAVKFNYFIERATIVAICLWGNWALYYWVAVLVCDASYIELKAYTPVLLLQIVASFCYLLRTDLGLSDASHRTCAITKQFSRRSSVGRFVTLSTIAMLLAAGAVVAADHFHWTESALSYNLLWAMLLPISLAYLFFAGVSDDDSPAQATSKNYRFGTVDCLLFGIGVIAFAFKVYGSGIPTWDDAFYGHVMSSTLANPTLPVQGQDLLLNTSAPYSIHPSYRGVGYEVFIALASDVLGTSPLHLYYDVFPVFAVVLWAFAAYLFMRAIRIPFPGLAVLTSFSLLLIWGANGGPAPSGQLTFPWWGKTQVRQLAAPLLFCAVAAYIQQQTLRTWLILLFCVCTVAIRSSTAMFVVPLTVAMATIVFLPSIRNNLHTLFTTFLSLAPIPLVMGYSLRVMQIAPVAGGADLTGEVLAQGQEFGGLPAKAAVLVILLFLPLLARSIRDARFQANILRVCILGIFTVMAPFFIETIATVIGLRMLSSRLNFAYPALLLIGATVSIAVVHLSSLDSAGRAWWSKLVAPLLALTLFGSLIGVMQRQYAYEWYYNSGPYFVNMLSEARDVRTLIADDAFVATGHLDMFIPILPEPPSFIYVRHYLNYHKYFLSDEEYADRVYLYTVLSERLPSTGDSLATTLDRVVATSDKLGVTTLIFQARTGSRKSDADKTAFVNALSARLTQEGYGCVTTPSGETRVCNSGGVKR